MDNLNQSLLYSKHFPQDLKNFNIHELLQLSTEIRAELIKIGETCGGHLASNLGVVELTIALHYVFNSPSDKMVWDVSHQCYVHKMLTGRRDQMYTIRQDGGLSGFAKISESEHDMFGAGHASTALSAALGMAKARDIQGKNHSVISVIGDATLSGGMAFEALNNVESLGSNMICILNDNDMSISPPVGNMANYMTELRTSDAYNIAKEKFESITEKIPVFGSPLRKVVEKMVDAMRDIFIDVKAGVLFEEFGFRYFGPIDGHNVTQLIAALNYAKTYDGPIMIHIITQKGKGHQPAELDPVKFHGVSPKAKPPPKKTVVTKGEKFTSTFGSEIIEIAKDDPNVVVITPAMREGSGLVDYEKQFPERYFDVGIAEEHAVTFSAGLAQSGLKPWLAIYSTFLQRGYDQVIHDVCIQNLPVYFAIDRAGVVGEDGATHHGVFDYCFLLPIPNIYILAPKDVTELKSMMRWTNNQNKAVAIRYPKGEAPQPLKSLNNPISIGKAEVLHDHKQPQLDYTFISCGSMAWPAYEAAQELEKNGAKTAVINLRFIKPLDVELLSHYIKRSSHVVVIEEGQKIGGVSSHILHSVSEKQPITSNWHSISIPDHFLDHGKVKSLKEQTNLSKNGILREISKLKNREFKV
jgi:1-deoxy-D-xylulose-5-phosphate synthase